MRPFRHAAVAAAAALAWLLAGTAAAGPADRFAGVEVTATQVSGHVYMLEGSGGNIGASIGPDGTLIVDDQYAPLAERIQRALTDIGGDRPRYVLNTHYHGDHTGGNPHFGAHATIIAHNNVRVRLLAQDGFAPAGLPLVTFADGVNLHFNGDEVQVRHLPRGHTDGDSVVLFKRANVLHLGDHFFNGRFPYIDVPAGGSVDGYIANLDKVLATAPPEVRIIPGHGKLGTLADLRTTLDAVRASVAAIRARLAEGRSVDDIVKAGLGDRYDTFANGFINEERWIRIVASSTP